MDSDPRQASELLKSMVQADPRNIQLEGNYLAALYRCRNIVDFERGLSRALSSGVTVKSMLEVPPFKRALSDESRLRKTNKAAALLPDEVMERILAGL